MSKLYVHCALKQIIRSYRKMSTINDNKLRSVTQNNFILLLTYTPIHKNITNIPCVRYEPILKTMYRKHRKLRLTIAACVFLMFYFWSACESRMRPTRAQHIWRVIRPKLRWRGSPRRKHIWRVLWQHVLKSPYWFFCSIIGLMEVYK
jgi:hypothetical protein